MNIPDKTTTDVGNAPPEDNIEARVDHIMARYPDRTGLVLNTLNDIQDAYRYLPDEALLRVSENTGVPFSDLKDMAEFFGSLSLVPTGRYVIQICDGTCCHIQGAPRLMEKFEQVLGIKEGEVTDDGMISIKAVNCVGACGVAPVIVTEKQVYGCVKLIEVSDIAESVQGYPGDEASPEDSSLFAHLEELEELHGQR